MFQPWRIKLREAEEAYKADRLDEARELLRQGDLLEFLPAKKLMAKVAAGLARRGKTHAQHGHTLAGWRDLETAEALGANGKATAELRELLVRRTLAEVETLLAADEPGRALERLSKLEQRGAVTQEVRGLVTVATKLQAAGKLARQGQFAQAEAELASAAELRGDLAFLQERRHQFLERDLQIRDLRANLHDALTNQQWTEVLETAESILQLSPGDGVAADARSRAWAAAGMEVKPRSAALAATLPYEPPVTKQQSPAMPDLSALKTTAGPRFLMWIDGVGGYLVCEGDEVVLGQPLSGSRVDVPILGDVSRSHATIRRSGEGYLLVPRKPTKLDGREVVDAAILTDGATLELGHGVRLRFRQPHPLSRTARLEFASRHRTQPSCDGVILLAESCLIGPAVSSHVVCPAWSQTIILIRRENRLYCRAEGEYQIDGKPQTGQAAVERGSQITGEEFAIKLEGV
jgi:hypothetical protein